MNAVSKIKAWSVALFSCFCLCNCTNENATEEIIQNSSLDYKQMETQIHEQINQHRLRQGLDALEPIALIAATASNHNGHMIAKGEVCHHGFGAREKELGAGLGAIVVAENVGYGFQTAQGVVQAWIRSQEHKKNIEGDFDSMGIAASQNEDGLYYFTNIFVKR